MRKLFSFTIFFIALGAGLYTQRTEVLEWYRAVSAVELPEAVGYGEVEPAVAEAMAGEKVAEVEPAVVEAMAGEKVAEVEPAVAEAMAGEKVAEVEPAVAEAMAGEKVAEVETSDLLVESDLSDPDEVALPTSINLAVPFTSQAPQGNWDEPYQEACEEASVYMVHAYFSGMEEGQIPAQTADEAILQAVEFEMGLFGFYKDTTAEKTGMFAELLYGHAYQILTNPTVEDIQRELVQGHPVIVPAAGRLLGNPYFTPPGPLYHMLVIRGYTEDGQFIVNDPGTYRGEAFLYDFDTIMNAMHDWNDGDEITEGRKVALVLNP